MTAPVELIKELRQQTGAGIVDCKSALEQSDGNIEMAIAILNERGIAIATKKSNRDTNEGLIESYIHSGGRIGAIVEINCETDFVARTDELKSLAHDIAMQVAAMSPTYVDDNEMPADDDAKPQDVCLMKQSFIRDQELTVQDIVNQVVGKLGENIRIRRFSRIALGE